jgi:hypothetical protein
MLMRFSKLLAALAGAALLVGVLAATAFGARGMRIGVEDDWAFTTNARNANHAIAAAAGLHAGVVRVMVMWADIGGAHAYSRRPPRRRHYSFRSYDGAVTRALAHHMQVQMVLTGPAPAWATGNRRKGTFAPKAGYYGEFARQAAAWFRGRVQQFSVWNEPNYVSWLSPQRSAPAIYRALYQHAWHNIKHVDGRDQVLIGETSPYGEGRRAIAPLAFLRSVLCNGRCHLRTDGYAHHPYDFYHWPTYRYPGYDNVTIGTLSRLWNALRHWAHRGALRDTHGHIPQIYLTEFGYLSSGHARISDRRHAAYLKQAYTIALRTPHVLELLQYTLVPPHGRYAFFDMSILTSRWHKRLPYRTLSGWGRGMQRRRLIVGP